MVYRDIPAVKRFVTMADEPTERRREDAEEQESKWSGLWNAALTVGAVAGTALLAWGASSVLSPDPSPDPAGEDKDKKKMKQPGRKDRVMYREDFVADTQRYFRDLRQEKKNNKM